MAGGRDVNVRGKVTLGTDVTGLVPVIVICGTTQCGDV